jgi:hypothetical protein
MPSKKTNPAGQVGFYVEHFTRAELADLDRALNDSLGGEIGMLRVVMRRFFERAAQEADDLKALAEALRVLGMSCARLARLVTVEQGLQDKRADDLGEALSQSLAAVMAELNETGLYINGNGEAQDG